MTRLLITGCGRSGTKWAAQALTRAGTPCGHEKRFTPSHSNTTGNTWAESSWLAAPFTPLVDTHVVHLVRHPLLVIASLVARGSLHHHKRWGAYALDVLPHLGAITDPVERAACYWVAWNRLVTADERVQLEHVAGVDVTRWARIINPDALITALPEPAHASRTPPAPVLWRHVTHVPGLVEMAAEYGYTPTLQHANVLPLTDKQGKICP